MRSVRVVPSVLQTTLAADPEQVHLPEVPLAGCRALPSFWNITLLTPRYHDHVPTILQEWSADFSRGATVRFGEGAAGDLSPEMDLFSLPITPPVEPA